MKAFLYRGARSVRASGAKLSPRLVGSDSGVGDDRADPRLQQVKRLRKKLARREKEIAELRTLLAESDGGDGYRGIRPENIVWIFGSKRTGSTWLSSMMADLPDHTGWYEPFVGFLFGRLYYEHRGVIDRSHYIFGGDKRIWLNSIRAFTLHAANARFLPDVGEDGYLVVKEPHGSIGAPLLMEALPESRMIFLVRDPRDVVASVLDAAREGGQSYEKQKKLYLEGQGIPPDKDPNASARRKAARFLERIKDPNGFAQRHAQAYLRDITHTREAYEAHRGRKVLVRYEDLRATTTNTMRRIYSTLEIPVDEDELARVIAKHSWENLPEEWKGEGKFYRKATPGGWREDLSAEQIEIVERTTAPILDEFYANESLPRAR